jgi:hypothetical protein
VANEKLAEAERVRKELLAVWEKQLEETETARKAAEGNGASVRAELHEVHQANAAALERLRAEARTREIEIRSEAKQVAEAAVAERLAITEAARIESETACREQLADAEANKMAAEEKRAATLLRLPPSPLPPQPHWSFGAHPALLRRPSRSAL